MSNTEWVVLPHDPIEQLADNLWRVEGDLPNMALRRAMTVARLRSGALVLHSAIAMDDAGMVALEALGEPAFLVVPNGWHRLDAARYKARYPNLVVVCPENARRMVAKVVPVDDTYATRPELDPGDDTVTVEHFGERARAEGVLRVRSDDGLTLAFADTLFNLPHQPGAFWFVYGRLLGSTGGPRITTIGRAMLTLTRSRADVRASLARAAGEERLVRLIPGHGTVVDDDPRGVLRRLSDSL